MSIHHDCPTENETLAGDQGSTKYIMYFPLETGDGDERDFDLHALKRL